MAKKQSRRSVSMSRETYEAAKAAAAREGIALAEWVTEQIRAALPDLAPQLHASVRPRVIGPPVHRMTSAEVRRVIGPQTACANCIDKPATHRGRIDRNGPLYNLCDECELPADDDMRRTA